MNAGGKAIGGALVIVSLAASLVLAQAAVPAPNVDYSVREATAPPQIRETLSKIRANIARQNLSFKVGYTGALDRPLSQLAGTRSPPNLLEKVRDQNMRARSQALRAPQLGAAACSATDSSFDWRTSNKVTPVRDQGGCGSCWAFGTLGAFEGSYARVGNMLIDASEQDVLSCSHAGTCGGGWWAFDYVENTGVATESDYPYTATDATCRPDVTRPFRVLNWGYVSDTAAIANVSEIKQALCEHGPLAVAVNVTTAFQAYIGGIFNEHDPGDINHAITLIGWDETKKAWLIKNSWGTNWGETGGVGSERGYMWISYDSNKIGHGGAWVEPVSAPPPPPATPTQTPVPVPGLSTWIVMILAVSLGAAELYRRSRRRAG